MTKEEAIEIIECGEISNRWGKDGEEVEEMAIEALKKKPSISEDGTLTVNVEDGSKVSRVLVCGDNHFGGLYYPDQEPCDKCVYSTSEGCQYDDITETIPPFGDCISRAYIEPIIEELENICVNGDEHILDLLADIKNAPPVTPQPKSEWQQDHEILKAYSDGANYVLDHVRAEIEEIAKPNEFGGRGNGKSVRYGLCKALEIIDKYKAEGSEE